MFTSVTIKNYKSIKEITLDLGKVNVLIGENGAGKSNILEAIALAGAAEADKLDSEFLFSRGIRAAEISNMTCHFSKNYKTVDIIFTEMPKSGKLTSSYEIEEQEGPYPSWKQRTILKNAEGYSYSRNEISRLGIDFIIDGLEKEDNERVLIKLDEEKKSKSGFFIKIAKYPRYLSNFIIYSPEITSLTTLERDGQILPLGIRGEGLLKLVAIMQSDEKVVSKLKECMKSLNWFEDFHVNTNPISISLTDRYVGKNNVFDHRSVNEGFFYLLFYYSAILSNLTPNFFGVDNIDASLNPKLSEHMMRNICSLMKEKDKQIIATTHNPAILDGLDLKNDDQRLFAVSRNELGETVVRRIKERKLPQGTEKFGQSLRLSEKFIRGYLGALPEGF